MYSLLVKTTRGERVVEYTLPDEARQEFMRMLDDGLLTNYWYQLYLGFLLNGFESITIDGEAVFEVTTPVMVEVDADEGEGFAESD
jgi:hypothetical protein